MNSTADLIERLKRTRNTCGKVGKQSIDDAITALSPVGRGVCSEGKTPLPDEVEKAISRLEAFNMYDDEAVAQMNIDACEYADLLERQQREKNALEYAVQSYVKSIGELQQRIEELTRENELWKSNHGFASEGFDRTTQRNIKLQARIEELEANIEATTEAHDFANNLLWEAISQRDQLAEALERIDCGDACNYEEAEEALEAAMIFSRTELKRIMGEK